MNCDERKKNQASKLKGKGIQIIAKGYDIRNIHVFVDNYLDHQTRDRITKLTSRPTGTSPTS